MKIFVPDILSGEDIFNILGQVLSEDGELYSNQFTFDFGSLHDIDALALVSLHNLFAWLRSQEVDVIIQPPELTDYPEHSLVRYIEKPLTDSIQVIQGIIPLTHVSSHRSSSWVLTVFNRWLAEILGVSTLSLYAPVQFLRLLFRYATREGASAGVFLHSFFHRDLQEVRIIFAHYGLGIPQLTRSSWTALSNDAIRIARSTELDGKDQKQSLYFLIDDVVLENGGEVTIYSGFGRMKCQRTEFGLTQKLELNNACFPGAIFDIMFRIHATGLTSRINEPVAVSEY